MSTRDRILRVATDRIADVGYADFTVASVRDELGLSSGSMFHAFPSKAALGAAVYVEAMVDYQAVAVAAMTGAPGAREAVLDLVAAHLRWVEEHAGAARYLFATLPDDVAEHAEHPLTEHNDRFFAALDRFFDRLREAELMGSIDRPVAHAIALGPTQEYCRQWLRGRSPRPPSSRSDVLGSAALAGLAATRTEIPDPDRPRSTR